MRPRLIHPIPISIEVLGTAETKWDQEAMEPIGETDRSVTINVKGQVQWRNDRNPKAEGSGLRLESDGYIIMKTLDIDALVAAGTPVTRGDKIVLMGGRPYELFILGNEPAGHYPDVGGAGLMLMYFASRRPGN